MCFWNVTIKIVVIFNLLLCCPQVAKFYNAPGECAFPHMQHSVNIFIHLNTLFFVELKLLFHYSDIAIKFQCLETDTDYR